MAIETIAGIKITHLLAGIAGGTMRYILGGTRGWIEAFTSVLSGCIAAAYMTIPVYFAIVHYFPAFADPSTEHTAGFLVGLTGLLICEGIMNYAKRWKDNPTLPPRFQASPPAGPTAPADQKAYPNPKAGEP